MTMIRNRCHPERICPAGFLLLIIVLFSGCGGKSSSVDSRESNDSGENPIRFLVGSSDRNREHSIYLCELDPGKPQLTVIDSFAGAVRPSYLALNQQGDRLYTIDSRISDSTSRENSVTSFRVTEDPFSLEFLNSRSSMGRGPCHVSLDREGNYLFVANYNSAHAAALPIGDGGEILESSSVVRGNGSGPVESRQQSPHAHQVVLDPLERYLLVPDLGADRVFVYEFDAETGKLKPNPLQRGFSLKPGSGPRHLAFHPAGDLVYIVNELNSTVTSCRYDYSAGLLTEVETLPTTEAGDEPGFPAAIRVHPSGKTLYASTRKDQSSLAVYRTDEDGWISRIQVVKEVPHWPRDFNVDPTGGWLIVAGERSGEIRVYKIDRENGKLTDTGTHMYLSSPGCILFL